MPHQCFANPLPYFRSTHDGTVFFGTTFRHWHPNTLSISDPISLYR
jgi:hypothetical protein